jgi:hypothetical protein
MELKTEFGTIVRREASLPETCSNCGDRIGNLEIPHLWREQVVCAPCYGKLAKTTDVLVTQLPTAQAAPTTDLLFLCPVCHSGDTCSFPSAWASGTTKTSVDVIGMGLGGSIGVGGGLATSITIQASLVAPPQKKEIAALVLAILVSVAFSIFLAVLTAMAVAEDNTGSAIASAVSLVVMILLIVLLCSLYSSAAKFNERELPIYLARWRRQWLCRRCGTVFDPSKR